MKIYIAAIIILLITFVSLFLMSQYTPWLDVLEGKSYDFMMSTLRGAEEKPRDIVIVAIDESSLKEFANAGMRFPWPRRVHAELIRLLNEAGARCIIFDVAFTEPSTPQDDQALAAAIQASRAPVVLASTIDQVRDPRFTAVMQIEPLEILLKAGAKVGYATEYPDRDGVLRRGRLSIGGEPTLATQTLAQIGGRLDLARIPQVGGSREDPAVLIDYVGPARFIPTVSYYQALDYKTALPKDTFSHKLVFVGRSLTIHDISGGETQKDIFESPWELMPGVEVHANILNALLRSRFISQMGVVETWLVLIIPGLLICGIVLGLGALRLKVLLSVVLILLYLAGAFLSFAYARHWMQTVQPVAIMLSIFALNTLYQYRATEKERAHLREAFKGYVSHQVMHEVLKNPDRLGLEGKQVEATVLFSDIAGFSKMSEKVTAQEMARILNDYFTRTGDEIMKREGMINKYIGDAIMAIWGAPLPNPSHAALACQAALAMKRVVDGMAPLRARIGINSGLMVAGDLGHRDRKEYTVIGDEVNLASRLEGANKGYGTTIMISDATEELVRGKFLTRELDCIRVLGKEEPIRVYEVLAETSDPAAERMRPMVESFQGIIDCYWKRQWESSCVMIADHLKRFPQDTVARTYLNRCRQFVQQPPAEDWDGVFALEAK
ncbi:MAG TPA: adenylate/guanylate cyclase domain-containing protein [Acidobacteriota bacterium]|jgi:adenylate cyclase